MSPTTLLAADTAWPLWDEEPIDGAFDLNQPDGTLNHAVVLKVERPWLFGYHASSPNHRGFLILGGGGYTQLMVGREGIAVAKWLSSLGYHAFVLVHRFPTAESGPQAPLDDARRALQLISESGLAREGLGICGLSSGGHLAAALLAGYPSCWKEADPLSGLALPKLQAAIIGYGPISTNAVGRQIIPNKPALDPPAKQELYNVLQPDVQISDDASPTFIIYSGNDPVVPVGNAYRLAEGLSKAKAPVELHVFADAPHGFALDTKGLPVAQWPALCEAWMRQIGFL